MELEEDPRVAYVRSKIKSYPDFPKDGIDFKDIFVAMRDPKALENLIEVVKDKAVAMKGQVDCVVGLDSRGFLFGPIMAIELGVGFVPIRKQGKLPGDCCCIEYALEYGNAAVEVQKEAFEKKQRILIVDDLLATGGTLKAAVDLVRSLDSEVVECFVIMELAFINGREKVPNDIQVTSLIPYDK